MRAHVVYRQLCLTVIVVGMLGAAGCGILPDGATSGSADEAIQAGFIFPPRVRYGSYAVANIGTTFLGPDMGPHDYYWPFLERNGIAYTCRGGHIDIIHLRIAADWTAFLTAESFRHMVDGDRSYSYTLSVDRSRHFVQITYPPAWDCLSEADRAQIAREVALVMGPYLAFRALTWHEILTWYGYKCVGLPVEFASAFSWEDSYSNLLGTRIAVRALQDSKRPYNEAVTVVMAEELAKLGIQTARVSRQASASVRGEWYTGPFPPFVDMKKRNFDIGLQNGHVTPTLVPDVPPCADSEPLALPAPTLEALGEYGFSVTYEIEPHEWEKGKILRIVHDDRRGKRIDPEQHFAQIMYRIQEEATARYGPEYRPTVDEQTPQYVFGGE